MATSNPRTTINTFFLEDHSLWLVFLGGVFRQGELLEVLENWFEEQVGPRSEGRDSVNCIVDLRAMELGGGAAEDELTTLLSNINERICAGETDQVALVSGIANYALVNTVMGDTRSRQGGSENFYSLDNACNWLGGGRGDALRDLALPYQEYRHEIRPVPESDLVVRYISGRVTRENIYWAIERLVTSPFYHRGCRVLTDCRDASFMDVGMVGDDSATKIMRHFNELATGGFAYVLRPDDLSKVDQLRAQSTRGGLDVKAFVDLGEACDWLGHDARPVLATIDAMRVRRTFSVSSLDLRDWTPAVCETGRRTPDLSSFDGYRDNYIDLKEFNLVVRRLSGYGSAAEFLDRTAWLEARLPYLPGRKILLDIRAWELPQTDRVYFSQGAGGNLDAAVRASMATLCSRELLHVAEGFAATSRSWNPNIRAMTTAFSASAWLGLEQPLVNRCLEILETVQSPK